MSISSKVLEYTAQIQQLLDKINAEVAVGDFKTPTTTEIPKPKSELPPVEKAAPLKSELKLDYTKVDYLDYGTRIKPTMYLDGEVWGNINKLLFADGYRWSKEDRAWMFRPEEAGKSAPQKAAPTKDKATKVIRISEIGTRKSATIEGEVLDDPTYKDFNRKDGTVGAVTSFRVSDGSGQVRVSMWDDKAKYAMNFIKGDKLRLTSLMVKDPYEGTPQLSGGKYTEIMKL